MPKTSRVSGFSKMSPDERLDVVGKHAGLEDKEFSMLRNTGALPRDVANGMTENMIGAIEIPLGICTNITVNGKDYLVPMAINEPSVIAAASRGARIAREHGGFTARYAGSMMRGQIPITGLDDVAESKERILEHKLEIIEEANRHIPSIVDRGGGVKDLRVRPLTTKMGEILVVEPGVDVLDAMGANVVNTVAEAIAPLLERYSKGEVIMSILSNLSDERLAYSSATFDKGLLGRDGIDGADVVKRMLYAWAFAEADPYRAATHNKGAMNGVIAVAQACMQDTRAIEAGAHAYVMRKGKYTSMTTWSEDKEGNLVGEIEMPMAIGTVGGFTAVHPKSQINLKILGVEGAGELAQVMVSVGLAQNFAAMHALVTEGIQKGHMRLHARSIAINAGAHDGEIDRVASMLAEGHKIDLGTAMQVLAMLRK